MLISISAAQSQGKSTVLKSLGELGHNISKCQTARNILHDWNFTLEEVNSFPKLNHNFQNAVLKCHRDEDLLWIDAKGVTFKERSYADVMAYTMLSMGSYNSYSSYIDQYYETCRYYQSQYACVIFLTGRNYTPENDGVRSINKHYAKCADLLIKHFVDEFDCGNVLYVDTPDHDERIDIITKYIDTMGRTKSE